jgi:predicted CopG family antitoxin
MTMATHEDDRQIPWRDFIEQHLDRDGLCGWLQGRFPALKDDVEDLLSDVIAELLKSRKHNGELKTPLQWRAFVKKRLKWRALDLLRAIEGGIFERLSGTDEDSTGVVVIPDSKCGPKTKAQEGERRGKQVLLLSDVLREFVEWCEERPSGHTMKEVYERRCRGQEVADIAGGEKRRQSQRVRNYIERGFSEQWSRDSPHTEVQAACCGDDK